jgi:hypothetical protein
MGNIPGNDLALMTNLTLLCVHGCASARSPLPPPLPHAHFALPRLHALHLTFSVGALGTRRRLLNDNQLNGTIPSEVGLMTALINLCVHSCAPRPTRPFLRPRRALTSLLPASVHFIPRSPLARSLRDAAQGIVQQPAHRSNPTRTYSDAGAV